MKDRHHLLLSVLLCSGLLQGFDHRPPRGRIPVEKGEKHYSPGAADIVPRDHSDQFCTPWKMAVIV